jgi:signal transduction histidine kinase
VAEKIAAALLAPGAIGDHVLRLSACIGIAVYPQDGEDAALLIDHADTAMHRAKARGPGRVAFHGDAALIDAADAKSRIRSARWAPNLIESTPGESDLLLQDLREANERLLISATDAQERESNADEAHRRQVKLQAVVVHELRNPLTPIRMAAEMLKRVQGDDQMIANLPGMIERQVSLMVRLIDDLLDSSRVNTGKFRLDYASVALNQVIATAVEIARAAIDSRRQTLRVSVAEPLPVFYGDAARLTQILGNLLDNASKYTPEGGDVALTVDCSNGSVEIVVSDNGIGIGVGMLSKVFDLFVQDNTGLVRHNSGLGIGLAVVRELVNAHGGTVTVESAGRNHGCKFVVMLPVRETSRLGEA